MRATRQSKAAEQAQSAAGSEVRQRRARAGQPSTSAARVPATAGPASSPRVAVQRQQLQAMFGSALQRAAGPEESELQMKAAPGLVQRMGPEEELPVQGKFATVQRVGPEEEQPLQGKFATVQRQGPEEELQMKPASSAPTPASAASRAPKNDTGLPDGLKAGIESLSGVSLDPVRVHYGSSQPAQLNALAYAQGTDIHVAPGQERHLPHEAWHVVQQAQGRVKPTMQMKGGVPVNDDQGLEHEADVMGARAVAQRVAAPGRPASSRSTARKALAGEVAQRVVVYRLGTSTDTNLCPRNPQDMNGAGRGLSTSTQAGNGKAQIIETGNLGAALDAVNDHGSHYAIRPANDVGNVALTAWAAARGGPHVHTASVRAARTGSRSANGVVGNPD